MAKNILVVLGSFFTISAAAQNASGTSVQFLDGIEMSFVSAVAAPKPATLSARIPSFRKVLSSAEAMIEKATTLQFKYSLLLDTEVEEVTEFSMYEAIDNWFGTRYRYGGTSRSGIDCSAFVREVYNDFFGIQLPRTAREQHNAVQAVNREEMRLGDLVFFNTRGGVSHVGIYLQNNKFVHAASSGGVMISDLFDSYWVKRFIGAGRHIVTALPSAFTQP